MSTIYKEIEVIHYGDNQYSDKKFVPVRNNDDMPHKPIGGLWTSPVGAKHGWFDWCMAENFQIHRLNASFVVRVQGIVHIIDSVADMNEMPFRNVYGLLEYPDYDKIARKGWDAIWLTDRGQWATRLTHPRNLYGWDCECVLILNPYCIFERLESNP